MTTAEFVDLIRRKVSAFPTQKDAAKAFGVSEQYLSDALKGRREPGAKLCEAFGVRRVLTYEPLTLPEVGSGEQREPIKQP